MKELYVVGGQQRYLRSILVGAQSGYEFQKGLILRVNVETGTSETCVEYVSPPEACAAVDPVVLFKSATLHNNTLYCCTQTEVLVYSLPNFEQVDYLSLPFFNDLHHVRPTPDGNLLIANTGLDMVLEMTRDGQTIREWNVLGEEPWARFSKQIDYRKGVSTKPHRSHPNHVFYIDEDIWVTRFEQKDAVCLTRPDRQIQIGLERVHDGVPHGEFVYFTTVDGHIVITNQSTLKIEDVIDLNTMHDSNILLGWCRSILVEGDGAWVGFSRLRPTKFRDNVSWVKNGFKRILPTHLAYYDFAKKQCVMEIDVEAHGMNAIFSVFPCSD